MKYILLLIFLFPLMAFAQFEKGDTALKSIDFYMEDIFQGHAYEDYSILMDMTDSSVIIRGDTMKVIMLLLKNTQELHKREDESYKREVELWEVISASVAFLNELPDYWRDKNSNCKWPGYYKALKKQGFFLEKKKRRKIPCP